MAKNDKRFSIKESIKSFAQGDEEMYDYDDMVDNDMQDFSGKSGKSINLFFMKQQSEYKKITESLKRGSVCIVNLSALSQEEIQCTTYIMEGILDAVRGTKEKVGKDIYVLLPATFAIRMLNELDETQQ